MRSRRGRAIHLSVALLIASAFFSFLPAFAQKGSKAPAFTLAAFRADVTPPVGHMLLTGRFVTAEEVEAPLEARGLVLKQDGEKAIVLCSVDWSEIRSETFDLWRDRLAAVAGTDRQRVLLSAIHQHDTPMGDLGAERILRKLGSPHQVIDPEFHEKALRSVEKAMELSLSRAEAVTHIQPGKGKVEGVASNRRYELEDGSIHFNRGSACKILSAQRASEGAIDPFLRSISFWNEDELLATYSVYATHPMSYYGTRKINPDFPGLARAKRQEDLPESLQIYASGCSGNVTAGKFNDGAKENRAVLADRLYEGMVAASEGEKHPLRAIGFRCETVRLEPRKSDGFSRAELETAIREKDDARTHLMSALGLSWLERVERDGGLFDIPMVTFNGADAGILLLPGEIYVDYQLYALSLVSDNSLLTPGFGDSAAGYLPTEKHWEEKDSNLKSWCWIEQGMEDRVKGAIRKLLLAD